MSKMTKTHKQRKSEWEGDRGRERYSYSEERVGGKEERKAEGGIGGYSRHTAEQKKIYRREE